VVNLREATATDARRLNRLIREMGRHERLAVTSSEARLIADGFGSRAHYRALIAEVDGRLAGYALFFGCYSSFRGRGVFLEDVYVRREFRGHGVGRALVARIGEIAVDHGCFGITFNVLAWNLAAVRFFKRAGASVQPRMTLCLAGKALHAIATGGSIAPSRRESDRRPSPHASSRRTPWKLRESRRSPSPSGIRTKL
jgi:GNAT superfamily N-acetyltransferase